MTVGIVGAGQLGRMLALAGYPLGLDFLFLDPAPDAPAGRVAPVLQGPFTDAQLLAELSQRSQVITFDWENISVDALRALDSAYAETGQPGAWAEHYQGGPVGYRQREFEIVPTQTDSRWYST